MLIDLHTRTGAVVHIEAPTHAEAVAIFHACDKEPGCRLSEQDERAAHPVNLALLAERMAAFDARPGPRVGDFLQLPRLHEKLVAMTRITHDWGDGDLMQTGGTEHGSYYLGSGLSYSGGLDTGIAPEWIEPEPVAVKHGRIWFFHEASGGAGRGVDFYVPLRVFALKPGAPLDGFGELRSGYHLSASQRADDHGYLFRVTRRAMGCTAFKTEAELLAWMEGEGLELTHPLQEEGRNYSHQGLRYRGTLPPP